MSHLPFIAASMRFLPNSRHSGPPRISSRALQRHSLRGVTESIVPLSIDMIIFTVSACEKIEKAPTIDLPTGIMKPESSDTLPVVVYWRLEPGTFENPTENLVQKSSKINSRRK